MRRKIHLFRFAGLEWSMDLTVIPAALGLLVVLTFLAIATVNLPLDTALVAGVLGVIIHYGSDIVHNVGHGIAAHRSGYPMRGIHLFIILAGSVYPRDEPVLPAKIHIQRALGGPLISFIVTLIVGVIMILAWDSGGLLRFVTTLAFWDNLLVFSLGALFPPLRLGGFSNDGGTILTWWGKP